MNNVIENCSGNQAISAPGNNNMVKYNEILNVGRHIYDGGAIYFGYTNTMYGCEVMYNYIHHLNKDKMYAGLYSDDAYGGIKMSYNVLNEMDHPIHIGLGANCQFNHNMFMNVNDGIYSQKRGADLYKLLHDDTEDKMIEYEILAKTYPEMQETVDNYDDTLNYYMPYKTEIKGNVWFSASPNGSAFKYRDLGIGSEEENPSIIYDSDYFVNDIEQDYTIKKMSDSIPTVSEINTINMNVIGFETGRELLTSDTTLELRATYSDDMLNISWDKPETASKFTISGVGETITYYDNNLDSGYSIGGLTPGVTYNINVVAEGLARQDIYSVSDTVSVTIPKENTKEYLGYAVSLLNEELSFGYEYDENSVKIGMETAKESAQAILDNSSATKEQIVTAEDEIYSTLQNAYEHRKAAELRIKSCAFVDNSTVVKVTADGVKPNSLVTAVVTNPDYTSSDLTSDNETEVIRFVDTIESDETGNIEFTFNTKKNDIDYTGVYRVYLTDETGNREVTDYIYGTIETGTVSYKSGTETISVDDLGNYKGKCVTISIPVLNRLSEDITPCIILGFFGSNKLVSVYMSEDATISKNTEKEISIDVVIPETLGTGVRTELFVCDYVIIRQEFKKPLIARVLGLIAQA